MENAKPESTSPAKPAAQPSLLSALASNPVESLLLFACVAVTAYFYGIPKFYMAGVDSALSWWWSTWSPDSEYEHGKLLPFALAFLLWRLRRDLVQTPKSFCWWGVPVLACGIALYLVSVRMLQPRLAVASLPIVAIGAVLVLYGTPTARLLLFPFFFPYLLIPLPSLEQATFWLQFVITGAVSALSNLFGLSVEAVGTTLFARDGDFFFEVAGGCSGVRSLMAMSVITAIYVYLTQNKLWKQLLIFACSMLFALVGNIVRVVTIILVAKFHDPELASGLYHDYSGFIFFPVALAAMVLFSTCLNLGETFHQKTRPKQEKTTRRQTRRHPPMRLRLTALFFALSLGLGSVHLLPKRFEIAPASVVTELPTFVGPWFGEDRAITDREYEVLAGDTKFSRKLYTDGQDGFIVVSIVFSGQDLNSSIHRPERCLPAQGWSILDSTGSEIAPPGARPVPITRLLNYRFATNPDTGDKLELENLNYYTFVGAGRVTRSHYSRTFVDMWDRLFQGYNQSWAYITVTTTFDDQPDSQAKADAILHDFMRQLFPEILTLE